MLKCLDCGPYIVAMDQSYANFNVTKTVIVSLIVITLFELRQGFKEIAAIPEQEYNKENIHYVTHSYYHYIKHYSNNIRDRSWNFSKFYTAKFRTYKFRINDPESGKEEWEVVLTKS